MLKENAKTRAQINESTAERKHENCNCELLTQSINRHVRSCGSHIFAINQNGRFLLCDDVGITDGSRLYSACEVKLLIRLTSKSLLIRLNGESRGRKCRTFHYHAWAEPASGASTASIPSLLQQKFSLLFQNTRLNSTKVFLPLSPFPPVGKNCLWLYQSFNVFAKSLTRR